MPYKDKEKAKQYAREYNQKRRNSPEYVLKGISQSSEWYKENTDRAKRSIRNSHLKKAYGITLNDYDIMYEHQEGLCAICTQPETINKGFLAVDHDHKTGKVRALLCQACNVTLGKVNEKEDILLSMVDYLRKHK